MVATKPRGSYPVRLPLLAAAVLIPSLSVAGWRVGHLLRGVEKAGPRVTSYPAFTGDAALARELDAALDHCTIRADARVVSSTAHGLMLWGDGDRPQGEGLLSGREMLARILDHREYIRAYGKTEPLLSRTRYGARFAERREYSGPDEVLGQEAHVGQLVSVLGELGVPASRPVMTADGPATVRDLVDDLALNFSLDEELDWTATALALYLPPVPRWKDKFGRRYDFGGVADLLLKRPLGGGSPCGGTHTLYTLALFLQADERGHVLGDGRRARVADYLRAARDRLARSQRRDGSWRNGWDSEDATAPPSRNDLDHEAVWITGHQLDWMAVVGPELRVDDAALRRAALFACRRVAATPPAEVRGLCQHFHGLRGARRLLGLR